MAKKYSEITTEIEVIQNETLPRANTADRVGKTLKSIKDKIQANDNVMLLDSILTPESVIDKSATRLQVTENRHVGLELRYGDYREIYKGTTIDNVAWALDSNWTDLPNKEYVDGAVEDLQKADKTIEGIKTFTGIPILPDTHPTSPYQATLKEYVDDHVSHMDIYSLDLVDSGIDLTGKFQAQSYAKSSRRFFGLENVKKIAYNLNAFSQSLVIAFYSSNKEEDFISGIQGNDSSPIKTGIVDVPSTAKYVRFTSIPDTIDTSYIITNSSIIKQIEKKVNIETGKSLISDLEINKLSEYPNLTNEQDKFVRADGELAKIVVGSGGYAANVYLSSLASDIPTYKTLSYDNDSVETTIVGTSINNSIVLMSTFAYGAQIGIDSIDPGAWRFNLNGKISDLNDESYAIMEVYKRSTANVETLLFQTTSAKIETAVDGLISFESIQPQFLVNVTDRLVVKLYVTTTSATNKTLTINVGGSKASYFNTPLAIRHTQIRLPNEDANVQHMTSAEKAVLNSIKKKVVTFTTDVATTRKLVLSSERVVNYMLSYSNLTEQYISTTYTDVEWVKDANWRRIANETDIADLETKLGENVEPALAEILSHQNGRIQALEDLVKNMLFKAGQFDTLEIVKTFNIYGATNIVLTGTTAPSVIPDFVGQFYVNTSGVGTTYQAKGNTSTADWKQTSN